MKETFKIFLFDKVHDEREDMSNFIHELSKNKRKFIITKWDNANMTERGFVVWYYH